MMTADTAECSMYVDYTLPSHHGKRVADDVCTVACKSHCFIIVVEELYHLGIKAGEFAQFSHGDRIAQSAAVKDKPAAVVIVYNFPFT